MAPVSTVRDGLQDRACAEITTKENEGSGWVALMLWARNMEYSVLNCFHSNKQIYTFFFIFFFFSSIAMMKMTLLESQRLILEEDPKNNTVLRTTAGIDFKEKE